MLWILNLYRKYKNKLSLKMLNFFIDLNFNKKITQTSITKASQLIPL